jgi:hypothetical protein
VVINYLMWDNHAQPEGIAFLLLSLLCAFFYRQAPMRTPRDKSSSHLASSSV